MVVLKVFQFCGCILAVVVLGFLYSLMVAHSGCIWYVIPAVLGLGFF